MVNGQDYTYPKKTKRIVPSHYFSEFSEVMERLGLAIVKWYAQSINKYSLCFRSGVETIDAIATLIHTEAPMTAF